MDSNTERFRTIAKGGYFSTSYFVGSTLTKKVSTILVLLP